MKTAKYSFVTQIGSEMRIGLVHSHALVPGFVQLLVRVPEGMQKRRVSFLIR